jgi:hypothetical protein
MRDLAPHLPGRLVLAQPFIDDLGQQIVLGPGKECNLGDELGPHPMDAAQRVPRGGARSSGIEGVASG